MMIHGYSISILISYALAGSTAWAQLFGLKYISCYVVLFTTIRDYKVFFISPFVLIFTTLVVFGYRIIRQVITFGTLLKVIISNSSYIFTGHSACCNGRTCWCCWNDN